MVKIPRREHVNQRKKIIETKEQCVTAFLKKVVTRCL